jgi:hypothetical protein
MSFINLDWSLIDKKNMTHDLIKVALFNLCAHIVSVLYFKEEFLNHKFLIILFAIELGFALFYIFLEPGIFHNIEDRNIRKDLLAFANSVSTTVSSAVKSL